MTDYKLRLEGRRSPMGTGVWAPGRARSVHGPLVPCKRGLHFCRGLEQAVGWLNAELWTFEDLTPEETIDAGDKMVTRKGRILERVESWNERTARLFAADCAEEALDGLPERDVDERSRRAIEVARAYARGEASAADLSAARSAARSAAESAAESAAWSAAWSAAGSAAERAAWSAAGRAAGSAARTRQAVILGEYLRGERA
ncbi:MAG TPA: hypothetical protein VGS00_11010 [Thermoanaerobaculia bacterium]|nr:hypothetical protein [Thermoanaerobaculia bacterium]